MKNNHVLLSIILGLLVSSLVSAAPVDWSGPNPNDVPLNKGVIIEAVNCGGVAVGDLNGINFEDGLNGTAEPVHSNLYTAFSSSWDTGWGSGSNPTGNAKLDDILAGHRWAGGSNPVTFTLSGLVHGAIYQIQMYMNDDRGCCAGRTYHYEDENGNASVVFARGDNVSIIGTFQADSETQNITVITEPGSSDPGLSAYILSNISALASNPLPESNAVDIETDTNLILSWDLAVDPNQPDQIHPGLTGQYVNFGTESGNLTQQGGKLGASTTSYTINSSMLDKDVQYFWRIDSEIDGEIVEGVEWTFLTELAKPQITQQPSSVSSLEGRDIEFSIIAFEPTGGDLSYQWYFDPNTTITGDEQALSGNGADTDTLSMMSVSNDDEGYYYCVVSSKVSTTSDVAQLITGTTIAYWSFEGNVNEDISGTECTAGGDLQYIEGRVGENAIELDGDDYVQIPGDVLAVMPNNMVSVSVWFAGNEIKQPGRNIFGFYGESNNRQLSCDFPWGDGNIYFDSGSDSSGGGYNRISKAGEEWLYDGQWHFAIFTKDANAGEMKIYIDGKLWASGTNLNNTMTSPTNNFIGSGPDGANAFNGKIDEFTIYDIAIDDYDAAQLYFDITGLRTCLEIPAADINGDCIVDIKDIAELASNWLECGKIPASACQE